MPPTLRMKIQFWDPRDVAFVGEDGVAPANGWAIGSAGVFKEGHLVSTLGTFRVHARSPDALDPPADLLVFEDREIDA